MNKIKNTHAFMRVCAMIIFGILAMLKLRRHHHKGVYESAGIDFDTRLKKFKVALAKATQFVQHALNHAR